MPVVFLAGGPVLSDFRRDKLNQALAGDPGSRVVAARELFLAELDEAAGEPERRKLARLLGAEPFPGELRPTERAVVPRPGTVSPWSSKATDIARRCGLSFARRLERGRILTFDIPAAGPGPAADALALVHDRMVEQVVADRASLEALFRHPDPRPLRHVALGDDGHRALEAVNEAWGLALSGDEIGHLVAAYGRLGRDPTDAELMMFAQANSEHCRHKIFNAAWTIDGEPQDRSLFALIRASYEASPAGVLTAYSDNAAVIEGFEGERFEVDPATGRYRAVRERAHAMIKVETHNHPTAISPHPGAATGAGGEIRDEAATGRGGKPKAGLTGFSVSHLRIPGLPRPWEGDASRPARLATPLEIMIDGPLGAAAFNNEFGRPALGGYFRTLEIDDPRVTGLKRGYHKPIMIAGGLGAIGPASVAKGEIRPGDAVVVLGGPALLIGLGGGAASSVASGRSSEALDYASVQRDNPEMQRRCQEVIDRCRARGEANPIVSIHDVGAGGLSNAIPELLDDSGRGGRLDLRAVPLGDSGLSPMEIWCNEAQERYVLGVRAAQLGEFRGLCERERCPFAVLGRATDDGHLHLADPLLGEAPVDLPLAVLFGDLPRMAREARRAAPLPEGRAPRLDLAAPLEELLLRVLTLPAVASKRFLVTIGDRSVGGLVARDQLVGPWQVPVADAAVTLTGFSGFGGEALAMGERTPVAILDAPASGRLAVAEAITNLASAPVERLGDVKLSANWMAAAGADSEDAALFDTVRAVGAELCPALGIAIPVGKDSLSMQTVWQGAGGEQRMTAPVSLIVSAFAPLRDVRGTLTPALAVAAPARLVLLDLGRGKDRLGASALAQVQGTLGATPPDLDAPEDLKALFDLVRTQRAAGRLLAYHDRSDGGVLVTLLEMAFAARCGLEIVLPPGVAALPFLFNEEPGAVVQVPEGELAAFRAAAASAGLGACCHEVATVAADGRVRVRAADGALLLASDRETLERAWVATSHAMQAQRDHPECADEELATVASDRARLVPRVTFDLDALGERIAAGGQGSPGPAVVGAARPRVAILREQGVNGHVEMAAAFDLAGFDAIDVHMSDLVVGRRELASFQGLVACGGFSYGDVLGAGNGWARAILFRDELRHAFATFLAHPSRFALGVCNGCQALAALAELVPGSEGWPRFLRNRSEQFEARLSLVEVLPSPSLFLAGMARSRLPVVVSHGEGRASFPGAPPTADARHALRYVQGDGTVATRYPENPNGSPLGLAGLCNADGRVTIMMPHPERVFRTVQLSWAPAGWPDYSPWMRMFSNAREWVARA